MMDDIKLPPPLASAIRDFNSWSRDQLLAADTVSSITTPLYHYTDAGGLKGIIENQEIWFTSYLHLNDPSELRFGMDIASTVLKEFGDAQGGPAKFFCDVTNDLFRHENVGSAFEFCVASFSRNRDDLGQWRAYASNGRGYALGLAPSLFQVEDKPNRKPHENIFVSPVLYGEAAGRSRVTGAIQQAIAIITRHKCVAICREDRDAGKSFIREIANLLLADHLIWHSLTVKHEAYKHEEEVRLIILGQKKDLAPYITTRTRGSDLVPFIKSAMAVRVPGNIVEIVIGPAARATAEDGLKTMLSSLGVSPDGLLCSSKIPYTAF
jgi:hypothetical protein